MVVINNNPEDQTLELNRFSEMIQDYKNGTEVMSGKNVSLETNLSIEGKSSMIIELN